MSTVAELVGVAASPATSTAKRLDNLEAAARRMAEAIVAIEARVARNEWALRGVVTVIHPPHTDPTPPTPPAEAERAALPYVEDADGDEFIAQAHRVLSGVLDSLGDRLSTAEVEAGPPPAK